MWPHEKIGAERFGFGYLKVGRKLRGKGKGDVDVNVAPGTQRYEGFVVVVDMWRSQTMGLTGEKCCVLVTVKQSRAKLELWLKRARHNLVAQ